MAATVGCAIAGVGDVTGPDAEETSVEAAGAAASGLLQAAMSAAVSRPAGRIRRAFTPSSLMKQAGTQTAPARAGAQFDCGHYSE